MNTFFSIHNRKSAFNPIWENVMNRLYIPTRLCGLSLRPHRRFHDRCGKIIDHSGRIGFQPFAEKLAEKYMEINRR
jgi:hypothetical protein